MLMDDDVPDVAPVLVIVPCGSAKVWDSDSDHSPINAAEAYTGTPFKLNRQYAERFGNDWLILSAKYGFISPTFVIPETYEVTFNRKSTTPIAHETLRQQVEDQRLHRYAVVVALGGKAYREAVVAAFEGFDTRLVFPFAGLPIGRMLQATKRALDTGDPSYDLERLVR